MTRRPISDFTPQATPLYAVVSFANDDEVVAKVIGWACDSDNDPESFAIYPVCVEMMGEPTTPTPAYQAIVVYFDTLAEAAGELDGIRTGRAARARAQSAG